MRLLHTSDWHLGLAEHSLDRRPDHEHALAQIRDIAKSERVDVILNTGDLFHKANPDIETLRHAWATLEEMAAVAPVVVLCGNHDGPKLFELMGTILKNRLPIHFVDTSTLRKREQGIIRLPTADGEQLVIGAVPFIRSANFLRKYAEDGAERSTLTYAESVGNIQEQVGRWMSDGYDPSRDIRVFAAHLLLDNAETSGSEYRFHLESDFAVRPQQIPTAEYVAFGHIHKPQKISGLVNGRYAGSPMPIDFGERGDEKSVVLITGRPGYALDVTTVPLDVRRRMVDITDTLENISANRASYAGTIARVTVELRNPVDDLERRVRELLAETQVCSVRPRYPLSDVAAVVATAGDAAEASLGDLFSTYVQGRTDVGDSTRVSRYFETFLDQARGREEEAHGFADVDVVLR